jgi:hypothetical protein
MIPAWPHPYLKSVACGFCNGLLDDIHELLVLHALPLRRAIQSALTFRALHPCGFGRLRIVPKSAEGLDPIRVIPPRS